MIEVDEEGAEAAAATAVKMMRKCAILPKMFLIDHPFFFFITSQTGLPVFMGHILEPKTK
ncbi:unnamed protein product [Rodentolepis nana]|uniref:SERPIN domain-containing protein n=1 Tax=Rodentolepis nana TaxID=102285 RepID=A0A0R3TIU9_RODNA|nr:unnamed protein product [Rodentolepis nana]